MESSYLYGLRELVAKADRDPRKDRTGVGTYSVFGRQWRCDVGRNGFPLLTTKKVAFKALVVELAWFLRGDTNIKFLKDHNVSIWDEWADENGDLGPVYGKQWRSWPGKFDGQNLAPYAQRVLDAPGSYGMDVGSIDQIANVVQGLKTNPFGRRHIVTAWNPAEIEDMALPPCHCLFQFYVGDDERLHLQLYQRSADIFLGVPFNIASYALLLMLVAKEIGREPGEFVHTFGDLHLYSNHVEQAREQLRRMPRALPDLEIDDGTDLFNLTLNDVSLIGYDPHPAIRAEVAV